MYGSEGDRLENQRSLSLSFLSRHLLTNWQNGLQAPEKPCQTVVTVITYTEEVLSEAQPPGEQYCIPHMCGLLGVLRMAVRSQTL